MDQSGTNDDDSHHVIDILARDVASSASTTSLEPLQNNERPSSSSTRALLSSEILILARNTFHTRNPSIARRRDGRGGRNPLNSGIWICTELLFTTSLIVASIVVLSVSRHEHPRSPLRVWIVGYACGCFAILPLLFWRFCHRNMGAEPIVTLAGQVSRNLPAGSGINFSLSVTSNSTEENVNVTRSSQIAGRSIASSGRIEMLLGYFNTTLDCFFVVWFLVGNVWIFVWQASASEAPNLYRLSIVFLTVSYIGYAMPLLLCATVWCCLPYIISIFGFRDVMGQTGGAMPESIINALPTYKFKAKKYRLNNDGDTNSEGGVIAAGTDKERSISGEDVVCCICLAEYVNNEELTELPCSHIFHKGCVDKWLKIKALCPLCKSDTTMGSLSGSTNHTQEESNGMAYPM